MYLKKVHYCIIITDKKDLQYIACNSFNCLVLKRVKMQLSDVNNYSNKMVDFSSHLVKTALHILCKILFCTEL